MAIFTSRARVLNSFWHRWSIKRKAKRHGRAGIPDANLEGTTLYEQALVAQAQQVVGQIDRHYTERIKRLQHALYDAFDRLTRHTGQFRDKFEEYHAKRKELGRGVVVHISQFWYRAFLMLIVVGELVFNFQAFQVFQKPLAMTFLMALGVAVSLPVTAHFLGIWLKQWPEPKWRTAIYVVLVAAAGFGAINGVNLARTEYLRLMDAQLAAHEDVLQHAFALLNLLMFTTAIVLSYFAHDADPEIERLRSEFRALDRVCHGSNRAINRIEGQLSELRAASETEFRLVEAILEELLQLYRSENQLFRPEHDLPVAFSSSTENLLTRSTVADTDRVSTEQIAEIKERWTAVDKEVRARAAEPA